jgi:PAS domain-containing protein
MTKMKDFRILYLGDRQDEVDRIGALLRQAYLPVEMVWVRGQGPLQSALESGWALDLLLLADGTAGAPLDPALVLAQKQCPLLPVLLLSDAAGSEQASRWIGQGAMDVVSARDWVRLLPAVRRSLQWGQEQAARRDLEATNVRLSSQLRTVLDASSEGILVTGLAGQITAYNRKFLTLCGIPDYVLAPMQLEQMLQFLQDQFLDSAAFMREARSLAQAERGPLTLLIDTRDDRTLEARVQLQQQGGATVGRVFSVADVTAREQALEAMPGPMSADLLGAARTGQAVPWYLTEEQLVISDKALPLLGLTAETLPRDLPALEALIHPADLDGFHRALERPGKAALELSLRRGDGAWLRTRWTLKRCEDGYRGLFTAIAGAYVP